ncbi:MAG: hypothetical protein JWM48_2795 [Mycobacterium sp.]|nr:hypothetical protein [Mycobacterium sp.]
MSPVVAPATGLRGGAPGGCHLEAFPPLLAVPRPLGATTRGRRATHAAGPPGVFAYEQRGPGGAVRLRGLLLALAVDGGVLPHERTDPGVVRRTARLLTARRYDRDPVMVLATAGSVAPLLQETGAPLVDVVERHVRHVVRPVTGPDAVLAEQLGALAAGPVVIADGHHRVAAAQRLAAEGRGDGRVLALLCDGEPGGPQVLPIGRCLPRWAFDDAVRDLARRCTVTPMSPEEAVAALAGQPGPAVAAVGGRGRAVLVTSPAPSLLAGAPAVLRGLDVTLADALVADRDPELEFVHGPDAATAAAAAGTGICLVGRAVTPVQLAAAALAGVLLPRKATSFVPKPLGGVLLRGHGTAAG